MKKSLFLTLLAVLVCALTLSLVACDNITIEDEHTHTFATEWTTSDAEHWHAATCEHTDVVSEKAAHDWNVKVTQKATAEADGTKTLTCTVCGFTKDETFTYAEHEHILDWTSDYRNHVKDYICCDQHPTEAQTAEAHTFNENHVCTVCNSYSVIDEARVALNNSGAWNYALVLDNFNVNTSVLSPDNNDIHLKNIVVKMSLDANFNIAAKGVFDFDVITYTAADNDSDAEYTASTVSNKGAFVLKDNTFYLQQINLANDAEQSTYTKMTVKEAFAQIGIDDFTEEVDNMLNKLYDAGADLQQAIDEIKNMFADKLPAETPSEDDEPFDPANNMLFGMFFAANEDGSYTSDLSAILSLNDLISQFTLDGILQLATSTDSSDDYIPAITGYVNVALTSKIGTLLDLLTKNGIDLHPFNKIANSIVKNFVNNDANSIEDLLRANGFEIEQGKLLADVLDELKDKSVLDVINMIRLAQNPEATKLTLTDVTTTITELINQNKNETIYAVIAKIVNYIGAAKNDSETTESEWVDITAETISIAVDQIGNLINDAIKVTLTFDENNKVTSVMIKLGIEAKEPDETETTETTTTEEGDEEPAETDAMGEQIKSVVSFIRQILGTGIAEGSVGINFNYEFTVDFDNIVAEASKTATAA